MSKKHELNAEELFEEYKEVYRDLYALCHAICGNESDAMNALVDTIASFEGYPGKSNARQAARRFALNYDCEPAAISYFNEPDSTLFAESDMTKLCCVLVFGCGLSTRRTASLLRIKPSVVKTETEKGLSCVKASGKTSRQSKLASLCVKEIRQAVYAPDTAQIIYLIDERLNLNRGETEIGGKSRRLLANVTAFIMLLLIGFMLWTGAILLNYFRESAQANTNSTEESNATIQGAD